MCAVYLNVHPNETELYENPERTFRQLRTRRIRPLTKRTLYPSQINEINDIGDRQSLAVSYDKAEVFVLIRSAQSAAALQAVSVFEALGEAGIPITMVSVQPSKVSFVINNSYLPAMHACLQSLALCPEVFADCTKISVRENSGRPLFATITALIETLAVNNIPVLRLSESYGLIEILTESLYSNQVRQAIEKEVLVNR